MASIKVKFRPSADKASEGCIYYQITHERRVRQFAPGYLIYSSEWDKRRAQVADGHSAERKQLTRSIRESIHSDITRLKKICRKLDCSELPYTTDDIIDEFRLYKSTYSLFNYMKVIIGELNVKGKTRTAETYTSALNSFTKFRQGKDIMLDSLRSETIELYEAWLQHRGVVPNTTSFYMRILRAAYNRAVEKGVIENSYPFRHVYTGVDKTVKRALPLKLIKKIKSLNLEQTPRLDFARDIFMMSFYLRGMSFIDMAFLKKTDLSNGHITYRRRKTGRLLSIAWTNEMQTITDKYCDNSTGYLLPIIKSLHSNEHYAYRNSSYNINRNLKEIAEMAGITIPLTLYVARHSWASAARDKGIAVSIISEGMGHSSEAITNIYLASIDTSVIDRANSIILKSLR